MNTKRLLLGSLVVGAGLALARKLFMTTGSARQVRDSAPYDAIDAYVEGEMHRLKMPGVSLAIVEGDRIVHVRGFGRARPGGEAPTPQTPFFIGSLTKSFTALAVMQLVEAGKIGLDAPIQRYLPWFRVADPQASAQMTVRHLLTQTSGLPGSSGEIILTDFDQSPDATERQARGLSTLMLTRPPGAVFEYSNANYTLLGLIIEAASGESYADYLQRHILTPLGMRHTYTSPVEAKRNGLAMGHQYWFGIPIAAPNLSIPLGALPAGMLSSTAEDIARYLIAHLNAGRYGDVQILSSAGIGELHRQAVEHRQMGITFGYGMGWFVSGIGRANLVWHTGSLPDFSAFMGFLPEQKKGVVLLCNTCHHWMTPVMGDFGAGAAALLAGEQPAPAPFLRAIPWMLRAQLLVPVLQVAGVAATIGQLHCWRLHPERRPSSGKSRSQHVLLPLIPNLLVALTLRSMLGKRRGYLRLYMPDYALIAIVCGSFSLLWSFLRTGVVLRALREASPS
jgi:CubicO group peptidase (beta-lactamase class C family)